MLVLRIELMWSGLEARVFTHWTTFLSLSLQVASNLLVLHLLKVLLLLIQFSLLTVFLTFLALPMEFGSCLPCVCIIQQFLINVDYF